VFIKMLNQVLLQRLHRSLKIHLITPSDFRLPLKRHVLLCAISFYGANVNVNVLSDAAWLLKQIKYMNKNVHVSISVYAFIHISTCPHVHLSIYPSITVNSRLINIAQQERMIRDCVAYNNQYLIFHLAYHVLYHNHCPNVLLSLISLILATLMSLL